MAETPKRADRQEIARRVERGEKLLQKGKAGEALEEFLQTLAMDPANDTVRQMAADLSLSTADSESQGSFGDARLSGTISRLL